MLVSGNWFRLVSGLAFRFVFSGLAALCFGPLWVWGCAVGSAAGDAGLLFDNCRMMRRKRDVGGGLGKPWFAVCCRLDLSGGFGCWVGMGDDEQDEFLAV